MSSEARATQVSAEASAGELPPGTRVPLSRDLIIRTAVAYIEQFGIEQLTMRKLGQTLHVEAMALYRYVPGRDDLLDGVVAHVIAELDDDPDVYPLPRDGWQDYLQRLAHGLRRIALTNPQCFPLIASRPPEAPWLRPPLRSLSWVENFLNGLQSEGFSPEACAAAYRAYTSFLLGHLLLEASTMGADLTTLDAASDDENTDLSGEYPTVASMQGELTEDDPSVEFEESLENLLDRLARIRS